MPSVPSAALRIDIDVCADCNEGTARGREGLCPVHRSRWNQEVCESRLAGPYFGDSSLEHLARRALDADLGGTELLTAFSRQANALQLIWDAHQRGAVQLPASIAATIDRAIRTTPDLLSRPEAPLARAG